MTWNNDAPDEGMSRRPPRPAWFDEPQVQHEEVLREIGYAAEEVPA